MIKLHGILTDVEGNIVPNKKITFTLVNANGENIIDAKDGKLLVVNGQEMTDNTGYFEVMLYANDPEPEPTYYKVEIQSSSAYGQVFRSFQIHLDGLSTDVDITDLFDSDNTPLPPTPATDTYYVLNAKSDGSREWVELPASATGGDVLWSELDSNDDGVVDNAEKVNGKIVELDVNNVPVSQLQASDDFDNA